MAKKKIYRTLILLTVLSEEPLSEDMSIQDIDEECEYGEYTGKTDWQKVNEVLEGREAAIAVLETGSSPDFFQMDENGNELNDDENDDEE